MNGTAQDILMHYGIRRRSGRYPWGSGENPYQHEGGGFYGRVNQLRDEGFTYTDPYTGKLYSGDTAIAKSMGLTTTEFRTEYSIAKNQVRALEADRVQALANKGMTPTQIAKELGYANESSVRSLLNTKARQRMEAAQNTANFLKEQVDKKGIIDIGSGVERELGISKEKLREAIFLLKQEGYVEYGGRVPQATNPGKQTTLKVLCSPGTDHKDIYNYENINSVRDYTSHDSGDTFKKAFVYPASMDSKRLAIRYAEDGGSAKDGLVEIRRGVKDLDLGDSHYAQVRILVDGTHYVKGMAVYSDDMPKGVDVIFNTNKDKSKSKMEVLKKISKDPDNPFGSLIKENGGQSYYIDKDGKEKLSLINKRADEGDWSNWDNKLPSQFLSKQNKSLVKKQLNLAVADKQQEFDEICSLNNPTVKKRLLDSFADDCDSAAVHLKAAALPRQRYQVILPLTSIKDNEVYAPNYKDGETVALIRYPHGGTFEIPILTVNNKVSEGKKAIGTNPIDAIGINSKIAARLSGADFDGDTVMVVPCNSSNSKVHIKSSDPLKGLEGFDPTMAYGGREEGTFKHLSKAQTQTEMGKVSNLITDMTIKGATSDELARAVRHSMVVIDADKHNLDYQASEADNGIAALKKKYQGTIDENGRYHEGASTIISRAKSEQDVPKRRGSRQIDPETGEQTWKTAYDVNYDVAKVSKKSTDTPNATVRISDKGKKYVQIDGSDEWIKVDGKAKLSEGDRVAANIVTKTRTQKSTKMAETKDARTLVSEANNPIELEYASYANSMKALANRARKEMLSTGKIEYSASANKTYSKEVASLQAKLNVALKNAPRERQAQTIANATVEAKKKIEPDMPTSEIKKISQQALTSARIKVGAERTPVTITDREWEAIQSGAISESKLSQILKYTDLDSIREKATPRSNKTALSQAKINKIAAMKASGYTTEQIADALNISTSTVWKYLK